MRLRSNVAFGAIVAALALASCGENQPAANGDQLRRGIGANPDSLDPQKISGTWANDVVGDMFIGLFTEDAAAKPVAGLAEGWVVSEDQLTWTFKLKHTLWSDGAPLTAGDFVFAFHRLLDPKTAAAYASIQYGVKNAQAVNDLAFFGWVVIYKTDGRIL